METQKLYVNGVQTKEVVTNDHPDGSSTTHVQSVHQGSLGTTYKSTDAVVETDKDGNTHVETR